MIEFEKNVKIVTQRETCLHIVEILEEMKAKYNHKLENLQTKCDHQIVLYFSEENAPITWNAYATCLCCGKQFIFSRTNDNNTEGLKEENIISIMGYLESHLGKFVGVDIDLLIIRAREKMLSIAELDPNISFVALKEEIKNDLLAYVIETEEIEEDFGRTRKLPERK